MATEKELRAQSEALKRAAAEADIEAFAPFVQAAEEALAVLATPGQRAAAEAVEKASER